MCPLPEAGLDLGRRGVIWLEGRPVKVERTGAQRVLARLVPGDPLTSPEPAVIGALFGSLPGETPDSAEPLDTLKTGGSRRKDALAAIDRWYRREARQRIADIVDAESDRLGLFPERVSIRDQKTRWGSCSTSGTLSFNWRLVIGPAHALKYVVVHELVHIRHHDHSRRFWAALGEALPDWKNSADWLRANERALTAYVPKI
jgi:hypothetical protein